MTETVIYLDNGTSIRIGKAYSDVVKALCNCNIGGPFAFTEFIDLIQGLANA